MGLVYEQARYPQLLEIYGFVGGRIAGGQELCQFLFYGFFLFLQSGRRLALLSDKGRNLLFLPPEFFDTVFL